MTLPQSAPSAPAALPEQRFPSTRQVLLGNLLLSAVIYAGLMWLIYAFKLEVGDTLQLPWLPTFNAICNALSASLVVTGIVLIKRGAREGHRWAMLGATTASALFLVGYLTHHTLHGDTRFLTEGWLRSVYFPLLISHIVLAAVALPLILSTLSFAALGRYQVHRRFGRWTYPVWIYVSVTGVLVYVFLRLLNTAPVAG